MQAVETIAVPKGYVLIPEHEHKTLLLRVHILQETIAVLQKKFFGRKSEKSPAPDASTLFEAPTLSTAKTEEPQTITVPEHTRRKSTGRKPLGENLPREECVVELSPEEKICKCCGNEMVEIGRDVSERVEVEPPKVHVEKLIRPKYTCRCCNFTSTMV